MIRAIYEVAGLHPYEFVGNAFEYELGRRGGRLNVLGATSGDTGSAAEHALKGKRGWYTMKDVLGL